MSVIETTPLRAKTRIVATTDLPGVPRGTRGTLGRAVGLALFRYRVAWDNGLAMTSVLDRNFVAESDWRQFRIDEKRAADEAEASAPEPAPAEDGAATDGNGDVGGDDRLAALLAKSKAARAAKQG